MAAKIAYFVSHPIQYQTPLLAKISAESEISLRVFFSSDCSLKGYVDPGFGRFIEWDIPLTKGYSFEFLPSIGNNKTVSFWRPFSYGIYKILSAGNYDFVWLHGYARFLHWRIIIVAKILGIKVLIRDEATLISAKRGLVKKFLKKIFFYLLKKNVDGFLSIGSMNSAYYYEYGVQKEKIFMVPYAVDNAFFLHKWKNNEQKINSIKEGLGLDPNRKIILFSSKLINRKRPEDLLKAYIELISTENNPRPYLLFVGDGELAGNLKSKVKMAGLLGDVIFLGFINQNHLPDFYSICDVFVLPSEFEPWGLVINEAMNFAKPIITTNQVGAYRDLIEDGVNGYIYKVGDIIALKNHLKAILSDDKLRVSFGQESFKKIRKWSYENDLIGIKQAINTLGVTNAN